MNDTDRIKECNICHEQKSITDFYLKSDRQRYDNSCKKCRIACRTLPPKIDTGLKKCKHCGEEKPYSEYQKAGGGKWLQPYCKPCDAERKRKYGNLNKDKIIFAKRKYYKENVDIISERNKKYISENIEKVKERIAKYRAANLDKIKESQLNYIEKNRASINQKHKERYYKNHEENLEKQRAWRENRTEEEKAAKKAYDARYKIEKRDVIKRWREKNKDRIREQKRIWSNAKSATDIQYRIKRNLRTRIRCALKPANAYKVDKSESLLGCTIEFYKNYLESLFTEGMTWEKFLKGEIEIDHKIPCVRFNLTDGEQQRICFNYKNTQPLWMIHNMQKGTKTNDQWKQMSA